MSVHVFIPGLICIPHLGTSWWRDGGPANELSLPFAHSIDYHALVVEINSSRVKGFIELLRQIPPTIVEEKQRKLARARHHFLYDMSGASEDAFTMMMRELLQLKLSDQEAATRAGIV